MIKEKDLCPGRVLTSMDYVRGEPEVTAWLVIGFTTKIKRRHSRKTAPKEGWEVLMLSFGGKLQVHHVTPSSFASWKRLF